MKATFRTWRNFTAFILAAGMFLDSTAISRAQLQSAKVQSDSVMAVVADSEGLPLVPAEQLPFYGTFWIVRNSFPCVLAPMPCPPLDPNVPVYAISSRQFLVDETAGQLLISSRSALGKADYASIVQMQADELLSFVDWIKGVELKAEMSALDSEGPPAPGEGGGGEGGGGAEFNGPVYGTNDLWLEIISATNDLANFTIHTPDVAAYDLFGTTNLCTDLPGLNGTNWVWLLRTDIGQTNIVLTNLWPDMGFFRLGTMQDSDGDGLTDAYEKLVSHTNPNNWDTDGDGLSDAWEVEHGMNPNLDESAQTSGRLNYQYDGSGWLRVVSGSGSESITLDNEGNVQTAQ